MPEGDLRHVRSRFAAHLLQRSADAGVEGLHASSADSGATKGPVSAFAL